MAFANPEPFFSKDQWHTIHDFNESMGQFEDNKISFLNLHMSPSAFEGAVESIKAQEKITKVEQDVQQLYAERKFMELTHAVCKWGGPTGNRVWGNLEKKRLAEIDAAKQGITQDGPTIPEAIEQWLDFAHYAKLPEQISDVLRMGEAIHGFGVSYASKHLRLLFPEYFPVLDALISERFGIATNIAGYELFLASLANFAAQNPVVAKYPLGDIEAAIFKLIRNGSPPN